MPKPLSIQNVEAVWELALLVRELEPKSGSLTSLLSKVSTRAKELREEAEKEGQEGLARYTKWHHAYELAVLIGHYNDYVQGKIGPTGLEAAGVTPSGITLAKLIFGLIQDTVKRIAKDGLDGR